MLRITSGTAKNKRLQIPDIEGYRAVQEIAKLAIFSILGEEVNNAECLDLYAGSGNLGLEALSRGAKWCDFVDEHPRSAAAIEQNITSTGFFDKAEVIRKDSVKYVANTEKQYNIVFADPFYQDTSHVFLLKNIAEILKKDGKLVFLHGENTDIPNLIKDTKLEILTQRKFGKGYFSILKHSS